jgi:hypothetical protein
MAACEPRVKSQDGVFLEMLKQLFCYSLASTFLSFNINRIKR